MDPRLAAVDLDDLPAELAAHLAGAALVPITVGRSASVVARVERPDGAAPLVLKLSATTAEDQPTPTLAAEADRLRWLSGRFPAPEVVLAGSDDSAEWLLTTALDGVDATATPLAADPGRLAHLLGAHLRDLHDRLDAADCPFDGRTASLVAHARAQVAAGRIDPADFQPIHQGMTPEELLSMVDEIAPDDPPDLVVTHGDYCLPNVVLADDGSLAGLVDVGLLGVGDRYRDLGIGARSVAHNMGGGAVGAFIEGYGLEAPDLARLDAFVMIDELF